MAHALLRAASPLVAAPPERQTACPDRTLEQGTAGHPHESGVPSGPGTHQCVRHKPVACERVRLVPRPQGAVPPRQAVEFAAHRPNRPGHRARLADGDLPRRAVKARQECPPVPDEKAAALFAGGRYGSTVSGNSKPSSPQSS